MSKEQSSKAYDVFINSIQNKHTRDSYARGIKMFLDFTHKSAEEILEERKRDLMPIPNENSVDTRQRATRFEREYLEPFYNAMITKGTFFIPNNVEPYKRNTAAKNCDGIQRLLAFYSMGFTLRNGSPIAEGKQQIGINRFPMRPEHLRAMFWKEQVLQYKLALTLANDFPARIEDFLNIQVSELPDLNQEAPIPFIRISQKEQQVQKSCLSELTVSIQKST